MNTLNKPLITAVIEQVLTTLDSLDSLLSELGELVNPSAIQELRKKINARGNFSEDGMYQKVEHVINFTPLRMVKQYCAKCGGTDLQTVDAEIFCTFCGYKYNYEPVVEVEADREDEEQYFFQNVEE